LRLKRLSQIGEVRHTRTEQHQSKQKATKQLSVCRFRCCFKDYKILHDAGYNVLAYDLRNFGLSGAANGGIASSRVFEARDVIGSLKYVHGREETRGMTVRSLQPLPWLQFHVPRDG